MTTTVSGGLTDDGIKNNHQPVAQVKKTQTNRYTWTTTASYDWSIKEKNNFYALVGFELYHKQSENTEQKNRYFRVKFQLTIPSIILVEVSLGCQLHLSALLTAPLLTSVRLATTMTTSTCCPVHSVPMVLQCLLRPPVGLLPSISGAWVMSSEDFMKDITWLDELKIRAAIGKAGNNRIKADMWRYLYTTNSSGGPNFGESSENPDGELYYDTSNYLPNPDIKWETTLTRNFALDLSF